EPYMGEESIRRPPESKKAPITCAQASRAIGSWPTLKVIQLPSPTAGSSSPVEGIGLSRTRACWEDASCGRNSAAAPIAAKMRSSRRRLSGDICSIERSIEGRRVTTEGPRSDAHAALVERLSQPSRRRAGDDPVAGWRWTHKERLQRNGASVTSPRIENWPAVLAGVKGEYRHGGRTKAAIAEQRNFTAVLKIGRVR